jgi:glycosyltransferase involved in cell wall biosynthesis
VIRHLRDELLVEQVILYIRADQEVDFTLPNNWRVKKMWAPRLWTHIRLSLEMLLHCPDVLLVPAHTVPLIHPHNTIVVVHGLEYEVCPQAYSLLSRLLMRLMIRFSCYVARTIICVSKNTREDVNRLYHTSLEKMQVVYEGYVQDTIAEDVRDTEVVATLIKNPYILFIGRLEERKNIIRFIEAFELFKEKYATSHQLVLVGKAGYGYEAIQEKKCSSLYAQDIVELGYVNEEEKWQLLKHAEVFLFATLYEGFGIPVLEAQSVSIPVITSTTSSLPEVAGEGAVLVHPERREEIADALHLLTSNNEAKSAIIQKGQENVKRFSWQKCAQEIAVLLKEK